MVVINKTDRVTASELEHVEALVRALNPGAEIVRSERGKVPMNKVLGTGRFDMGEAERRPAWIREMMGTHTPETEEYGISSFVYRARDPFHPVRFAALLQQPWAGVVRAKGWFWVASRPNHTASFQLAGGSRETQVAGMWWAAVPLSRRPDDPAFAAHLESLWHEAYGDRRQEIVIIGVGMDEDALRAAFDACLLTDAELSEPEQWAGMPHPFAWPQAHA